MKLAQDQEGNKSKLYNERNPKTNSNRHEKLIVCATSHVSGMADSYDFFFAVQKSRTNQI